MFNHSVSLNELLSEPGDKEGKELFDGFKQSLKRPKVNSRKKIARKKKKLKLGRAKR